MDRQRRSTDSLEDSLWSNPCDYDNTTASRAENYEPKLAKEVASQARNAKKLTEKYKDTFANQLHSYPSFDELLKSWSTYDWLRNSSWYREAVLPKEKVLNRSMPDEYMNSLMDNITEILPAMYKSLKLVVAGLNAIYVSGTLDEGVMSDGVLKNQIRSSMHDVRAVLCIFSDIMRARNLEIMPLTNDEIPHLREHSSERLTVSLLIYRDTLNYLEYLAQVFQKMYDTGV